MSEQQVWNNLQKRRQKCQDVLSELQTNCEDEELSNVEKQEQQKIGDKELENWLEEISEVEALAADLWKRLESRLLAPNKYSPPKNYLGETRSDDENREESDAQDERGPRGALAQQWLNKVVLPIMIATQTLEDAFRLDDHFDYEQEPPSS